MPAFTQVEPYVPPVARWKWMPYPHSTRVDLEKWEGEGAQGRQTREGEITTR
jgi:hypothetical protein